MHHSGGYAWSYNTQNYLNEYYKDYNPGLWLAVCSIFGGSFGVFVGGWLSDQLVKKWGLHSRLWLLSFTTVIFRPLETTCIKKLPIELVLYLLSNIGAFFINQINKLKTLTKPAQVPISYRKVSLRKNPMQSILNLPTYLFLKMISVI